MKHFILFILTALCLSAVVMIPFAGGIAELASFVSTTDALQVVGLWALGFALAAFVFSLFTKDYSWVDRIWSVLPVAFAWYYAFRGGCTQALCAIAVLVTIWGARLTFNFARKGGYTGMEDYRWNVLRGKIKIPFLWQLFNLLFICLCQLGMFVLFTYPIYSLIDSGMESLPALFWAFAGLGLALICFETTADQQQWNFHNAKQAASAQKDFSTSHAVDIKNGFLSRGLFALSRHPNYFGELGFWWAVWLTAFSLTWEPLTSGIFGPLALTALFIGSTIFTESITSSKYPEYKNYQKRVSAIIPWFPSKK